MAIINLAITNKCVVIVSVCRYAHLSQYFIFVLCETPSELKLQFPPFRSVRLADQERESHVNVPSRSNPMTHRSKDLAQRFFLLHAFKFVIFSFLTYIMCMYHCAHHNTAGSSKKKFNGFMRFVFHGLV